MQFAIIKTNNRVIARITTDSSPQALSDETAVDVSANPLDLTGGPWKLALDNKTLVKPTQAEIDASGVDEKRNAVLSQQRKQAYLNALDAAISNVATPPAIKTLLQSLKAIS